MASSKEYLHFILEQLSDLDDISYRPKCLIMSWNHKALNDPQGR